MRNRTLFVSICLLFLLIGCTRSPRLEVEGKITNANGKVLYFELFGIDKTQVLDSVKLDKSGRFKFKTILPEAPEFYRLRIDNRFIHLGADSAAIIKLHADGVNFGNDYKISGSKCCEDIRMLSRLQGATLMSVDSLSALLNTKQLLQADYQEKMLQVFDRHRELARKTIYDNPRSPAAYFALFQRLHNYLIFDPYDAADNKSYAAVATSWDTYYPNSLRSKHLKLLTLQGMKEIRQSRDARKIDIQEKSKQALLEIKLPNVYGKIIPLSALQGKVVLLDFTVFQADFSPSRNLYFRELYHNYAEQGFEIYQVSLDADEQYWKTGANNLPWICVRDNNSAQSSYLRTYNVQSIPTYFLIDRNGDIALRDAMVNDLNKEILKLL
ncbi:MAG TPA: TlpA disulfide reductase family protein [Bacteroidales bacterium]|nr:TlpA disulfide reductase family protein [Bacteroidales bacterium]